jgi:hypothetical protein
MLAFVVTYTLYARIELLIELLTVSLRDATSLQNNHRWLYALAAVVTVQISAQQIAVVIAVVALTWDR